MQYNREQNSETTICTLLAGFVLKTAWEVVFTYCGAAGSHTPVFGCVCVSACVAIKMF